MQSPRILSFDVGAKNLAYCIVDVIENVSILSQVKIIEWDIISLRETKEKLDFGETIRRLMIALKDRFMSKSITHVVIENQPAIKNPLMKSIQVAIYTYFHLQDMEVRLMNASNKLKVSKKPHPTHPKAKLTYNERKKLAISIAREYIVDDEYFSELFESNSKKDDLSDCYLQAIYCVENNLIAPKSI